MTQAHLFILDPLSTLNLALDTSLRWAFALHALGHEVWCCEWPTLSWHSRQGGSASALCARLDFAADVRTFTAHAPARRKFSDFSAIHMRRDPPVDMSYVYVTWLLDSVSRSGVHVLNHPSALRSINEKLAIYLFSGGADPEAASALVSCDPSEILAFIERDAEGDAIVKPLDLFGGRGVERVELAQLGREHARQKITLLVANGCQPRIVQPFNKAIFSGEVRCFAVGGEPVAWCLKKPAAGQFLANTRAGATLGTYAPTAGEVASVRHMAKRLLHLGAPVVGFDVIGGIVSEVNITSPRLLVGGGIDERPVFQKIAEWTVQHVAQQPKAPELP